MFLRKLSNILSKKSLHFLVILLVLSNGCGRKYTRAEIPEGEIAAIDGLWELYSYAGVYGTTLKIEKSRAYSTETNNLYTKDRILLKDIKKATENSYSATMVDVTGTQQDNITLLITSDSTITMEIPYSFDFYLRKSPVSEQFEEQNSKIENSNNGVELITFKEERVKALEQTQNISKGSQISVTRSRTIVHTVSFETVSGKEIHAGAEADGKIDVGAILINNELMLKLTAGIRAKIEEKIGRNFEERETFSTTVTIDGNKSQKWKFVWYDRVTTGIARYTDENGKKFDIPYQFPIISELDVLTEK